MKLQDIRSNLNRKKPAIELGIPRANKGKISSDSMVVHILVDLLEHIFDMPPQRRYRSELFQEMKRILVRQGHWKNAPRGDSKGLDAVNEKRRRAGLITKLKETK